MSLFLRVFGFISPFISSDGKVEYLLVSVSRLAPPGGHESSGGLYVLERRHTPGGPSTSKNDFKNSNPNTVVG